MKNENEKKNYGKIIKQKSQVRFHSAIDSSFSDLFNSEYICFCDARHFLFLGIEWKWYLKFSIISIVIILWLSQIPYNNCYLFDWIMNKMNNVDQCGYVYWSEIILLRLGPSSDSFKFQINEALLTFLKPINFF